MGRLGRTRVLSILSERVLVLSFILFAAEHHGDLSATGSDGSPSGSSSRSKHDELALDSHRSYSRDCHHLCAHEGLEYFVFSLKNGPGST